MVMMDTGWLQIWSPECAVFPRRTFSPFCTANAIA
jgi:hypothetical protein